MGLVVSMRLPFVLGSVLDEYGIASTLKDLEVDFDVQFDGNRLSLIGGGLEAVLLHRIECFLVKR